MTIGTKEWKPNNENCIEGCENDCLYCYAALWAERYGRVPREDWHIMKPNKRSQHPVRLLKGGVMFPTTHDLHFRNRGMWMPFLIDLLAAGNDVLIVTKPEPEAIKFICDTFHSKDDQIEFRFTIGTDNDETRKFWEPGAPSIGERIQALRYAYEEGYKTSISIEPLLTMDPGNLIYLVSPWLQYESTIWIGIMNHMNLDRPQDQLTELYFRKQLAINSRENMQRIYDKYKGNTQIRWKDSVQKLLGVSQS